MAERKSLNKYIPPDFDPKKIPRIRKPKNHQKRIRFMLPVRARCNKCGNYMSEGTKFNCREEQVTEETYLGLKIHRFYFKCTNCSAELTIKTDPQNNGYVGDDGSGATFPYNGHEEETNKKKYREDALESLEKRTMVSKRGIEVMAALDELKSMKSRQASVSVDSMLEALNRRKKQEEEDEDEEKLIRSIKFGKRTRIDVQETHEIAFRKIKNKPKLHRSPSLRVTLKKKATEMPIGLKSLCHNYVSDTDDEEK